MPDPASLHLGFPAERFISQAEFSAEPERTGAQRARQQRAEAQAAATGPELRQTGTCALCLRACVLTSHVASAQAADWPSQQRCDCEHRLCGRERALLHAAQAVGGLRAWSRVLLWGETARLRARLALLAAEVALWADFAAGPPHGAFHTLLALDCSGRVTEFAATLGTLRRLAAPGACLLASLPFDERAVVSTGAAAGWDFLARLREVGWEQAEVLRYWSRELGYFGRDNFLVRAAAL